MPWLPHHFGRVDAANPPSMQEEDNNWLANHSAGSVQSNPVPIQGLWPCHVQQPHLTRQQVSECIQATVDTTLRSAASPFPMEHQPVRAVLQWQPGFDMDLLLAFRAPDPKYGRPL